MTDNQVRLTIDGREISADAGSMLIEVADASGIHIPRFCYHRKLSVAANCRMCMVDVEKAPKPLPACATPIADGMVVSTKSARARAAQKSAMEFLLINHPLDCPICDQGGECELQDVAMSYGGDVSQYTEAKRVVQDKDIGPLIETELTRCIHCTRCVRFGEEVAGIRELGATGRGEFMQIGTFVEKNVSSELSGNVIDLCPVGALTAKPSRYQSRPWELTQHPTVSVHDCVGANLYLHSRNSDVIRTVPRDNEAVNECWIADRDRYSYMALTSEDRLYRPQIRRDGQWQTVDWETALSFCSDRLNKIAPEDISALLSPYSSTEELYLAQKYLRALGVRDIDHRTKESDFSDQEALPLFPWLGTSIEDIENHNAVLLVGSNLRKDQPLLAHRLNQATVKGATVGVINPVDFDFYFPVSYQALVSGEGMIQCLAALAKHLNAKVPPSLTELVSHRSVSANDEALAESLREGEASLILLGNIASYHPQASTLRALAQAVAVATSSQLGFLPTSANAAGAWLAGAVPHRGAAGQSVNKGVNRSQRMSASKALFLMGTEVESDCADAFAAGQELLDAEFVVALSAFESDLLKTAADVILPIATSFETSGTYVNAEGRWQTVRAAAKAPGEARPAWKVLRVLGNLAEVEGFEYGSAQDVLEELKGLFRESGPLDNTIEALDAYPLPPVETGIQRVSGDAIYACDALCRRSPALQATDDGNANLATMNLALADALGLADGDGVSLSTQGRRGDYTVRIAEGVAEDVVYTTFGGSSAGLMAAGFGPTQLSPSGGDT